MGLAGESWTDRMIDVHDVDTAMQMVDRGFDAHGLRAWLVLAADGSFTINPSDMMGLVDRYVPAIRARQHKFLCIEIVNERADEDKFSIAVTSSLSWQLANKTDVLVIPSAPSSPDDYAALYAGWEGPTCFANMHMERDTTGTGRRWEPNQKPDEFPWVEGVGPSACASGEPIGPGSSVNHEFDPLRLVMAYASTHMLGCAAYCFHPGAGIRGGGQWDKDRGLPEFLEQTPHWQTIVDGFSAVRSYLPPDIANWKRIRGHKDENPINTIPYRTFIPPEHRSPDDPDRTHDNGPYDDARAYGGPDRAIFKSWAIISPDGETIYQPVLRLTRPLKMGPKHDAMRFEVIDPMSGDVRLEDTLLAGHMVTIDPALQRSDAWEFDGDGFVIRWTKL